MQNLNLSAGEWDKPTGKLKSGLNYALSPLPAFPYQTTIMLLTGLLLTRYPQ
jgi:hypothetical protein